jgi:hypothetical protein
MRRRFLALIAILLVAAAFAGASWEGCKPAAVENEDASD